MLEDSVGPECHDGAQDAENGQWGQCEVGVFAPNSDDEPCPDDAEAYD